MVCTRLVFGRKARGFGYDSPALVVAPASADLQIAGREALAAEAGVTSAPEVAVGLEVAIDAIDTAATEAQARLFTLFNALRAAGCDHAFANVQTGVANYVTWLANVT